jgi:hypothetical protein
MPFLLLYRNSLKIAGNEENLEVIKEPTDSLLRFAIGSVMSSRQESLLLEKQYKFQ